MSDPSEITTRSIRFGSCVSVGLLMSYVDGISNLEIAQMALLASVLFLALLLGEAALPRCRAMFRHRKKR